MKQFKIEWDSCWGRYFVYEKAKFICWHYWVQWPLMCKTHSDAIRYIESETKPLNITIN